MVGYAPLADLGRRGLIAASNPSTGSDLADVMAWINSRPIVADPGGTLSEMPGVQGAETLWNRLTGPLQPTGALPNRD
ncbi:MAG TPA: hypothetical protein VGH25_07355, partial [Dongiaceae bacterium]